MYTYAFVAYLDNETESCFNKIWLELSESNITQYGVENKGKRPHITIADYDNLDKNVFIEQVDKFYEGDNKISIYFNMLGTFINTGTLFVAPTLSTELLDFHKSHHNHFAKFNENEKSFYLPGKWTPHCTIASRLNEEKMIQAFAYCKNNINKIHGKISELALIEVRLNSDGIATEDRVVFSKELR
jgi:2'-5' RNA ligase